MIEYADGLRGTALILNGHVDDTTAAVRLKSSAGRDTIASTLMYLPAPPGARFFDPLVLRIEQFFKTGKPPYPVERTLLTGGILDAALDSRVQQGKPIATPELAAIDYPAPEDSGFIRKPLTEPSPNRMASLDQPDERIEELWAKEAEARLAAYEAGHIEAYPVDEVFEEFKDS